MIFKEHLFLRRRKVGGMVVVLGGEARPFFSSHLGSHMAGALPPQGPSPVQEV